MVSGSIQVSNVCLNTSSQGADSHRSLMSRLQSELGFAEAWTPESIDSLLRDVYRDMVELI